MHDCAEYAQDDLDQPRRADRIELEFEALTTVGMQLVECALLGVSGASAAVEAAKRLCGKFRTRVQERELPVRQR